MIRTLSACGLAALMILGSLSCSKPPKVERLDFEPAPIRMKRLLARQYVNTVRDLVSPEAAQVADPPADLTAQTFTSIGAATLSLSDTAIQQYETSALAIAEVGAVDGNFRSRWMGCSPTAVDDAGCHREFVEGFGLHVFRRPLAEEEINRYVAVAQTAGNTYGDFYKGTEFALIAFLQSPNFLYIVELGTEVDGAPQKRRLDGYEMAARLSFYLLDTTPSTELLTAAGEGGLDSRGGVRGWAENLIENAGARSAFNAFYAERFKLDRVDTLLKNTTTHPDFTPEAAQAMREEAYRLVEHVVWDEQLDVHELMTADYAFVNRDLAPIYGVTAPSGNNWVMRTMPIQHERAGIFSQAAFLAIEGHPETTSPTRRGRFIQERLLCFPIPPPPPEVNPELPAPDPGNPMTMRQRLELHQQDESCASCHILMDNVGFGLESYDGIGKFQTYDNGFPVDPTGEVPGVGSFTRARGLAELLADDDRVANCLVRNIYRHAAAHVETEGEAPVIEFLDTRLYESGYRVKELLVDFVASDAFRIVGTPAEAQ